MGEDKSEYWMDLSEYDLETAKAMQDTNRFLYVGFMCHQVVEKSLKALIAKAGTIPPKVHSLVRLAELSGVNSLLDINQTAFLNDLLPLNIEARYPSDKEQLSKTLNEQYCASLIEKTEGFFSWIRKQL